MLKFKIFPDIGIFHHSLFALTNNTMTEITVAGDFAAISCFKSIIMTSETSIRFKMTDMFRIMIISYMYFRESILTENFLNCGYRVIYKILVGRIIIIITGFVKSCNTVFNFHQSSIL